MPRRKSIFVGTRFPSRRKTRPIKIPQPETRPVQLHARNLLREDLIHPDPWDLTIHRRGPRRLKEGEDPLEARAIPHDSLRGTLPERIMYKWLQDRRINFDFQSSLLGGRLEFGGIVADFILPDFMYVLNPAGPTHSEFARIRKDEEQTMILAEFGYRTFIIPEADVYAEYKFEEIMRSILGLGPTWGGGSATNFSEISRSDEEDTNLDLIYHMALDALRLAHQIL